MLPVACVAALHGLAGKALAENAEKPKFTGAHMRMTAGRLMRAGDIACPGVELDELDQTCPVPLYPDMWNYWRVLRSSYDGTGVNDIPDRALAFMSRVNGRADGSVRLASKDISLTPFPEMTAGNIIMLRGACDLPTSVKPSANTPPFYEVYIRFVYRGAHTFIGWPAILHSDWKDSASVAVGNDDCPVNASWLLDAVYNPSAKNVPKPEDDSLLPPHLADNVPDLPSWALPVGAIGAVIVLGVAASYAVRGFR